MSKAKHPSPEDLLSTPEAGKELGIGVARVNILINEGRLPAIRIGRVWAIRRGDLDLVRDRPPGRPRNDSKAPPPTLPKPAQPKSKKRP